MGQGQAFFKDFGKLIGWTNGKDAATNLKQAGDLVKSVDVGKLQEAGVTKEMLGQWVKFYAQEAARNPNNPNAAARELLLEGLQKRMN